jgi:hypothetical protein
LKKVDLPFQLKGKINASPPLDRRKEIHPKPDDHPNLG